MITPISKDPYSLADEKLIRKIVRRLPKSGRLREWAEAALAGEAIPTDAIPELCEVVRGSQGLAWSYRFVACIALAGSNWRNNNRDVVCTALRAAATGMFEPPSSSLKYVAKPKRDRRSTSARLGGAALLLAGLILVGNYLSDSNSGAVGGLILGAAIIINTIWSSISVRQNARAETATRRLALKMLGDLGDFRAVGEVARSIVSTDSSVADAARNTLPSLLRAIKAEHYGMLPADATPALCALINSSDRALAQEAIEALARAGDGRAAKEVSRQRDGAAQMIRWLQKEHGRDAEVAIMEAASRALPILEERLRTETAAERLLRPAESPANPSEVLLRPAGSATSVPEEQLLRPTNNNEASD